MVTAAQEAAVTHAYDQCRRRTGTSVRRAAVATLAALLATLCASDAGAQCSPRAVLQNFNALRPPAASAAPPRDITSAATTPVWKTVSVGTTTSTFGLRNALDAANCGIGDLAEQVLARPAFTISRTRQDIDLVSVSVRELGFRESTARLAEIYVQAQKLGFELPAAEIGPQLRLQYFDQPIGEFLHIGMEPIRTWTGEPVILVVANGGAGLILVAQDGEAEAKIPVTSRFVFVRRRDVAENVQKQDRQ
jgi:hypothetical protein